MRRGVAGMLAVAAVFLVAIPARAVAAERSFTTSGSITYTWQGDPARGCAAAGLCGVQGALILQSAGGSSSTSGGPPGGGIDVPLETLGATVRVSDGPGNGDCIDSAGLPGGDLSIVRGAGGREVAHVRAGPSSGRCAGPRAQDLAALVLPVARSGGKLPRYDLHTTQSFAAGPFTGKIVSTIVVRSIPNSPGSGSVGTGPVQVAPPAHKVLLEQVILRYRLASLPSALDVAFAGETDPFCETLDSCGASGTLAFALPGLGQSFEVAASRQVSRRVDARQALADFRRGRLHSGGGAVAPQAGAGGIADVTETYAGSGGLRCQSASQSPAQPQLLVEPGSARMGVAVTVLLNNQIGSDLLRTYCPGPSVTDVFGSNPAVARATIGVNQLLARHSVISVTASGGFAGTGYVGSRSGGLQFSLTLAHVRAGTIEVSRP
jgi:hypothetical protein